MIEQHKPHSKSEVNHSAPEGLTIPNIGGGGGWTPMLRKG
jgi:hypothetical protein